MYGLKNMEENNDKLHSNLKLGSQKLIDDCDVRLSLETLYELTHHELK